MEKVYHFNQSKEKLIEKILDDDEVMINHMVLHQGEAMPEHNSNSNVYMVIIQGVMTLQLADMAVKAHPKGSIVSIPGRIKMNISNTNTEPLEFFVVKAPSPRLYK